MTVTPTSLTIGEGGSGTYTVVLDTQPTGDVTVTIVDPTDNTDVKAEPAALTFTTTNWNSAQTVTVSAVLDVDTDDDTATVTHTVSGYGSVSSAASVTVTVAEDPTAPYDTNGNSHIDKDEASVSRTRLPLRWNSPQGGGQRCGPPLPLQRVIACQSVVLVVRPGDATALCGDTSAAWPIHFITEPRKGKDLERADHYRPVEAPGRRTETATPGS